jgi:hypothetical protein
LNGGNQQPQPRSWAFFPGVRASGARVSLFQFFDKLRLTDGQTGDGSWNFRTSLPGGSGELGSFFAGFVEIKGVNWVRSAFFPLWEGPGRSSRPAAMSHAAAEARLGWRTPGAAK